MKRRTKKFWDKKGQLSDGRKAILMVLLIAILSILAYRLLIKGILDTGEKTIKCGSAMTGTGMCKESCDDDVELGIEGLGCDGITKMCCIRQSSSMGDVILPESYGRATPEYNFKVLSISIKGTEDDLRIANCAPDFGSSDLSSIRCLAGSKIILPIQIGVQNMGTEEINVMATPVYVINDNGDKVVTDQYRGIAKPLGVSGETIYIETTVTITPDRSIFNDYWEIYPYALCDTKPGCTSADTSSRGIYRKEATDSNMLTIKFVDNI